MGFGKVLGGVVLPHDGGLWFETTVNKVLCPPITNRIGKALPQRYRPPEAINPYFLEYPTFLGWQISAPFQWHERGYAGFEI